LDATFNQTPTAGGDAAVLLEMFQTIALPRANVTSVPKTRLRRSIGQGSSKQMKGQ